MKIIRIGVVLMRGFIRFVKDNKVVLGVALVVGVAIALSLLIDGGTFKDASSDFIDGLFSKDTTSDTVLVEDVVEY